jgi:hypothetical protein
MEDEMVDKRHRTSMSGIPVMEESSWGTSTARARYGKLEQPNMKAKDMSQPQDPIDKHGPNYRNEVPVNSWLRGGGESGKPPRGRK